VTNKILATSYRPCFLLSSGNATKKKRRTVAEIIERAQQRREIATDIDGPQIVFFSALVFYRYFMARHPVDGRWITSHVDAIVRLLRQN